MVILEISARLEAEDLKAALESSPGLTAWLQVDPGSASPEALVLAVRLWGQLPQATVKICKLLPKGAKPPPRSLFSSSETLSKVTSRPFRQQGMGLRRVQKCI